MQFQSAVPSQIRAVTLRDIDDCYFLDDKMRNPGLEEAGDDLLSSDFSNLSEPIIFKWKVVTSKSAKTACQWRR